MRCGKRIDACAAPILWERSLFRRSAGLSLSKEVVATELCAWAGRRQARRWKGSRLALGSSCEILLERCDAEAVGFEQALQVLP
ncbi:MAG: hypothetical protein JWO52_2278 [Gammaproteobacteria bacterium]|jgi:hypothetical protein|nr:hypothetical protein [Gammaproteobacteria bacterium]